MDQAQGPVALEVVEHHLRPAELVGGEPFQRPLELAPDVNALSDRALLRSVLSVPFGGAPAGGAGGGAPPGG
jgi:hypothetical protein